MYKNMNPKEILMKDLELSFREFCEQVKNVQAAGCEVEIYHTTFSGTDGLLLSLEVKEKILMVPGK